MNNCPLKENYKYYPVYDTRRIINEKKHSQIILRVFLLFYNISDVFQGVK